jgi:phosphate transport system protein
MSMAITEHTAKAFDADLQALTILIAEMGGHAEKLLVDAIDSLTTHDSERARQIIAADETIDALQRQIEQRAVATIATRQPMAVDLREIVAILRIANELERVGDLAKNIGKRVMTLTGKDMPRKAVRGVKSIAGLANAQLHNVLDSFVRRDPNMSLSVWTKDEEIDAMYTSLFRELLTYMMEDPETISFGIHLLFCAKNIERVGDHATNIAEAVYYMIEGHPLRDERPKADMTAALDLHVAH